MATYIMLSTLTDEGRKTLKERPERLQEVNREIEAMGARVTQQYAVLGGYDFINILEAPDNETDRPHQRRTRLARHRRPHDAAGAPRRHVHADAKGQMTDR